MSSLKQIRANRENGRRSSGPTTPEGLAASSRNALKHGLRSRSVLLPEEDPDAFHELLASLHIEHRPVGAHEQYLVGQMAVSQWRMDRLQRIEAGLLASRLEITHKYEDDEAPPEPGQEYLETTRQLGAAFYDDSRAVDSLSKFGRDESPRATPPGSGPPPSPRKKRFLRNDTAPPRPVSDDDRPQTRYSRRIQQVGPI